MLLCGNHNYKKQTFDLMVGEITIEDGAWVGAKSIVCPGVILHTHSMLGVLSVANHDLDAYFIYQGNPAKQVRERLNFCWRKDMKCTALFAVHPLISVNASLIWRELHTSICIMGIWGIR